MTGRTTLLMCQYCNVLVPLYAKQIHALRASTNQATPRRKMPGIDDIHYTTFLKGACRKLAVVDPRWFP